MKVLATIQVRDKETMTATRDGVRLRLILDDGYRNRTIVLKHEYNTIRRECMDEFITMGETPTQAQESADAEMEVFIVETELDPVQAKVLKLVRDILSETGM